MPVRIGDLLWRVGCSALLAWAFWAMAWRYGDDARRGFFAVASLLVLPVTLGTLRNGQTNLPLAALFALALTWLGSTPRRPVWSAAALCLAFVLKPIAIVPILLVGAFVRGMWWRLLIGLAFVAALPFLSANPHYAAEQYVLGWQKVIQVATPSRTMFADMHGALIHLGFDPDQRLMMGVQLVLAVVTGCAGLAARARFDDRRFVLALHLLSACYLMFANPRTEGVSYPIMAVPVAALACLWLGRDRRSAIGWALLVITILLGTIHLITPPKDYIVRPLLAIMVWGWVVIESVCGSLVRGGDHPGSTQADVPGS